MSVTKKEFKNQVRTKKWGRLEKRIYSLGAICAVGGGAVCAAIIVPSMLFGCKKSNKQDKLIILGQDKWDIPNNESVYELYKTWGVDGAHDLDISYTVKNLPKGLEWEKTEQDTIKIYGALNNDSKKEGEFDITAKSGSIKVTKKIKYDVLEFTNLPVVDYFYNIEGGVIKGFSDNFITNATSTDNAREYIDSYNGGNVFDADSEIGMSLKGQRITSDEGAFSESRNTNIRGPVTNPINFIYQNFVSMDLSNTTWEISSVPGQSTPTGASGNHTFAYADLSKIKFLNLENANLAPESGSLGSLYRDVHTGYYTFYKAKLTGLNSIDLYKGKLSRDDLLTDTRMDAASFKVFTASHTFDETNLSNLSSLDLSGCEFATTEMASFNDDKAQHTNLEVSTASYTFKNTIFTSLTYLNIQNNIFAAEHMTKSGTINTADHTFSGANFNELQYLDLHNGVLAVDNMMDVGNYSSSNNRLEAIINTANYTFENVGFSAVVSFDLSNCIFSATNPVLRFYSAFFTFRNTLFQKTLYFDLKNCIFSSTNMIQKFGSLYDHSREECITACYTFSGACYDTLETLDISSAIFSSAITTFSDGDMFGFVPAFHTFDYASIHEVKKINLGGLKLGDDITGINTIDSSCFYQVGNSWTSKKKLTINESGSYWKSTRVDQLNSWFGLNHWQ